MRKITKTATPTLLALALAQAGCSVTPESAVATQAQRLDVRAPIARYQLPYGTEPGRVGLRPAAQESLADGPAAIAIDKTGAVLVLDQRNARVLALEPNGVQVRAQVAADSELISVGADGALGVYSAVARRVRVLDPHGEALGEVEVPDVLRGVVSVRLGASRRVEVSNAFQDSFTLGSPSVPAELGQVLLGKQEGGPRAGSARLAVRKTADGLMLDRISSRGRDALPIGGGDAAQLVGVDGNVACMRVEQLSGAGAVKVARRVVCLDVDSGAERLAVDLPAVGEYLPRQELAVGQGRLAFMKAAPGGLEISVYALGGGVR